MLKTYLGDGVYVDAGTDGITLTTENGISVTNRIVLETHVLHNLQDFVTTLDRRLQQVRETYRPHDIGTEEIA